MILIPKWVKTVGIVAPWVASTVFGTGFFWQWKTSKREEVKTQIEITDSIIRVRAVMLPLFSEIVAERESGIENNELLLAKVRQLNELEKRLAVFEQRSPIDYSPPLSAPTNARVQLSPALIAE